MSEEYVYYEDDNWETGHYWRKFDLSSLEFILDPYFENGDVQVYVNYKEDYDDGEFEIIRHGPYQVNTSYACLVPKKYWEQYGHLKSNTRTEDVLKSYPKFRGSDDMESHFEFRMSLREMKKHLSNLGIQEVKKRN